MAFKTKLLEFPSWCPLRIRWSKLAKTHWHGMSSFYWAQDSHLLTHVKVQIYLSY